MDPLASSFGGPARGSLGAPGTRRGVERIAEETGGRFYTPESVAALPEDLQYTGAGVTVVEEKDLWDMPALLGLIVLLVGVEWALRRQWGLA